MKGELIQELLDAIARDVRIATLSAESLASDWGTEAFQNQTTQAPLNLAQTRYKLGLSSIVEPSPPHHFSLIQITLEFSARIPSRRSGLSI